MEVPHGGCHCRTKERGRLRPPVRGGSCTGFLGHRLNPGGNRDANRALHVVALNRLRRDPRTQEYVARRAAEGKTKREAMRCLKRYVAREVYRAITPTAVRASPGHPPDAKTRTV